MPPKAKPKAKSKGRAKASPAKPAREAPAPSPSKKRAAEAPAAAAPALKRAKTSELVAHARTAASGGVKAQQSRSVDPQVPNASSFSVVDDFAVKLNQTHMEKGLNNNKFYIIQALESGGKFYAWNRWGRVGDSGQNKLMPCSSKDHALKEFKKKFREKTVNDWDNRDSFKPVNGKYYLVDTEEGGAGDDAPMGKLTEGQIGKGQLVLDKLEKALNAKSKKDVLETLSSEFYSLIPHDFGFKRAPAIDTNEMLQSKIELLKFFLRMGFDSVEEDKSLTPISGIMDLPCPKTLHDVNDAICGKGDISASVSKGEEAAKKQAGNPQQQMSAHLYAAIFLYTGNAIYRNLNQCLNNQDRSKIKKYFKYLRLLFEAMQSLPKQKRTLYRGLAVNLYDKWAEGSTITWWGVNSCTSELSVAQNFAKSAGSSTICTIECNTASDISELSFFSHEKESLLMPGTKLLVKKKKMNGSVAEFTLQEVGNEIA